MNDVRNQFVVTPVNEANENFTFIYALLLSKKWAQIKLIFQYIKLKSSAYTTFLRTKFNLVVGEEKMKLPNFG